MSTTPTGSVVLDDRNRRFLVLRVALVHAESTPDLPDEASWCAHVSDPASPLAGLYAFGPSFDATRDTIAETAWAALEAGELREFGLGADHLAGIHVVATTTTVYDGEDLSLAVSDSAA